MMMAEQNFREFMKRKAKQVLSAETID